jgi:hypothetical protein
MIIVFLDICTPGLVPVEVGPAFLIDGINSKDHDISAVYKIGDGIDHAEILEIRASRVLRGKDQERKAFFTVDQDVHFPVQALALMGVVFSFHKSITSCRQNGNSGSCI